jgi:hypothetical protein
MEPISITMSFVWMQSKTHINWQIKVMKDKYSTGGKTVGWFCLLFCLLAFFPIGVIIFIFGMIELYSKVPE